MNTENTDIRWKQRYQNFEKAFSHLAEAVTKTGLSDLEKAGVIQIYEFTFELAWKTVKDFLEEKEVLVRFPKDTIKEAFKYEIIDDGDLWMDMLDKRNLMSHTYNETNAELAYRLIVDNYYEALKQVYLKLRTEL
ncbi:MAG TPA: nucleotidyltransferase substrate binding protein [Bacillota bacterium]|nr:nucleotidyltransferase substrate binding protein [Bacillota bacterium]